MSERMVEAHGIEIWTEDFGHTGDATILLIMGASAQGIMWPDEFCDALVEAGRHVIRYDNRDTGQSTSFDFSAKPTADAEGEEHDIIIESPSGQKPGVRSGVSPTPGTAARFR